jgi:hypothetical protein
MNLEECWIMLASMSIILITFSQDCRSAEMHPLWSQKLSSEGSGGLRLQHFRLFFEFSFILLFGVRSHCILADCCSHVGPLWESMWQFVVFCSRT